MTPLIDALSARGVLSALDVELARALGRISGETSPSVLLAAAWASRQVREGHVCADLEGVAGTAPPDGEGGTLASHHFPEAGPWLEELSRSRLVQRAGDLAPLVLKPDGRLYLARYDEHERVVAESLMARARSRPEPPPSGLLAEPLRRLFGEHRPGDAQRALGMVAVARQLCIVSGGPGTGKTSTVVKVLALIAELCSARGRRLPRVSMVAPTGKAAARLGMAVSRAVGQLDTATSIKEVLGGDAQTIHRALGWAGSPTRFRHNADNPLSADVVVVDESSMVDIALMRRLLEAVPHSARLILLGDENQLASVEAGAVFGDVCRAAVGGYSPELLSEVERLFAEPLPVSRSGSHGEPLGDCIVRLEHSYRFDPGRGIGRLARAIFAGDAEATLAVLDESDGGAELCGDLPAARLERMTALAKRGYRPLVQAPSALEALARLDAFRILAAHRRGGFGVEALNAVVAQALAAEGWIIPQAAFYPGRPLMITRNEPDLGLFNGDTGVIFGSDELNAWFTDASGEPRRLGLGRLPSSETVFAMSIHKSQGSEFDEVVVVLPDARSPLSTRELFYTAVTRARSRVVVVGDADSVRGAVGRRLNRTSGLPQRMRQLGA